MPLERSLQYASIPLLRFAIESTEEAIYSYLLQHNAQPKPFVWSKTAADILSRERRALDVLDQIRGNR